MSAREVFQRFEGRVAFEYLVDLPIEEVERRVSQLPTQTIVYHLFMYRDGAGHPFAPIDSAHRIARAANAPFYSLEESTAGDGVGGYVWSPEADATEAAKLGLRILAGERPQDIPPHVGDTSRYIFDWH